MRAALLVVLLLPLMSVVQSEKKPDTWQPLRFFVGKWEGDGKGEPGESKVEREYRFVLGGSFLEVRNKSTYAPQPKNPKGELHEDIGLISFDSSRKEFVFRQFHVEGFVNQYVLDSISADGKTIVFLTEAIENIPAGWRARETFRILGENEFSELFELSAPGKEFERYSEARLRRVK